MRTLEFFLGLAHTSDVAGTMGEVRVMVDGVQLGSTAPVAFLITSTISGSDLVAGARLTPVTIEVQARRTAGTGGIRCETYTAAGTEGAS